MEQAFHFSILLGVVKRFQDSQECFRHVGITDMNNSVHQVRQNLRLDGVLDFRGRCLFPSTKVNFGVGLQLCLFRVRDLHPNGLMHILH
jgi:hypothetical protein